ncbi:probable DNA primase small subunit [Methanocella paludicola SANAE]|uniref:DNA primase small subunit PriS n=1 Tax=Methanocella paludicola (strain DSM 17711 / JCM 13418 / NBRC 101707 / SANAE) TaxID=304371 RepID=D1YYT9_METPS|nr:DNA primase catalytic subunit PriS [Methanocella paludicola]BAI61611.1 probable DNA primase small subunit [Methanocella paludicola SANAE]
MNDQTRLFLKKRFREYYAEHPVPMPPGFMQREWGFLFYEDMPDKSRPMQMHRHKSFNSAAELNDYLKSMAPQHAYHSAAYYQYPQAPTMLEKKWLGADLIFDLDADHLPNPPKSYAGMLEMVKVEIVRLIDEFLIDDLGFSEKDMDIVFSGGRGYHVHIRDERVRTLKSPERREIVDYILGTGLNSDRIFIKATKVVEGFKGQKTTGVWQIDGFGDGQPGYGWNRRVAGYISDKLADIGRLEDKAAKKELKKYELDTGQAGALLEISRSTTELDKIRKQGRLEIKSNLKGFFKNMLDGTIDQFKVDVAGKTDEPVTADIKRLIRLPGSIHGGSSFGVIPLTRKQLETFNPLEDAIIFTESPVRVLVTKPQEVEIRGKIWRVSEGVGRLPENVAMYLMCRGSAEYEP